MDQSVAFLLAAFVTAWGVLLLYIASLASRLASVQRELEALSSTDKPASA